MKLLTIGILIIFVLAHAEASRAIAPQNIIGTWKLLSMTYNDQSTGKQINLWGEKPIGFLTYTNEGRMSAIISSADRRLSAKSADQASPEEQAQLFRSCYAYAGTYTMTENSVIHHVEVANDPTWVGKDQVRFIQIEGNKLIVSGPPIITVSDSQPKKLVLVWKRIDSHE